MRRVASLVLVAAAGAAAADPVGDDFPAHERCALCHGLDGVSATERFPNLAGQRPAYLEAQIAAFLKGRRSNDGGQMQSTVTELGPDDIPSVVEWFSTQTPPPPSESGGNLSGSADFAALGCGACHDAGVSADSIPHLTAQKADYLAKQMRDFRDGARDGGAHHRSDLAISDARIRAIADHLAAEARP